MSSNTDSEHHHGWATGNFQAARRVDLGDCRLVVATPEWAVEDLEAVAASRQRLKGLFGPHDEWPQADLSVEQNRTDLRWHRDEFEAGTSFAWLIVTPDETRSIGCLYLYPTQSPNHAAEGFLWTRTDLTAIPSQRIEHRVIRWVEHDCGLENVIWPGRSVSHADWTARGFVNYYTEARG